MKHNEPDHALPARAAIDQAKLQPHQYTLSLINEGLQMGLLDSSTVYDVQIQLMGIVADLIQRYTRQESSSVTVETAERLLTSVLYSIDAQLRDGYEQPEEALVALRTADLRDIYDMGVERVRECLDDTRHLYTEVRRAKLDVDVDAYNMTIYESVPIFLQKYEIVFDAYNTMASIDYPLAIDDIRVQGVFYVRQYLDRLQMETRFCSLFSSQDLLGLLSDFGKLHRFDYRLELFNIFELVFNNAVFSVLSGESARNIIISPHQFERLHQDLINLDASRTSSLIRDAVERLRHELDVVDVSTINYMDRCRATLVQRLINAASHNSLEAVIVTRQEEKLPPVSISFSVADKMSDIDWRTFIDELSRCEGEEAKASLIKSRLRSLCDYVDVLESGALHGNEYEALFRLFGDMELAVLAKVVFREELRSEGLSTIVASQAVNTAADTTAGSDDDAWQMHYIEFMRTLDRMRLAAIERLVDGIDWADVSFS